MSKKKIQQNKWKKIWVNKNLPTDCSLQDMIFANGFNTNFGYYSETQYRKLVSDFYDRTKFKKNSNVLDLGCGSGVFLFLLKDIINSKYYGIDYSPGLINNAKKIMPTGSFLCDDIISKNFNHITFDIIFSHSVFNYFPNKKYVDEVIDIWSKKLNPGGKLILMDLNNVKIKKQYHSQRIKLYKNEKQYVADYKGLNHFFFNQELLKIKLNKLNITDVRFFPNSILNYKNSKFRFNLIGTKK